MEKALRTSAEQTTHALDKAVAVLLAGGLDLPGEPPAAWHPVVWYGKLIRCLERFAPRRSHVAQLLYGVAMPVIATPAVLLTVWLTRLFATGAGHAITQRGHGSLSHILRIMIEAASLKPFFAWRMLSEAGRRVRLSLEQQDLHAARQALQSLVSRDRSQLDAQLVAAAAIESLAENLSDSIIAPLFYYALCGLPGAALYRLYNTFDSMIGYRGHYEYLGKAAARLDDLLNLLPARLTALLIVVCAPLFGGDMRGAWRIWRRDARKTASPNAGHPMAAAAGALGIQLEKVDHYVLGDHCRTIVPQDIRRAEQMVWWVGGIALLLTALAKALRSLQHA
ncbi:MAG: cobalamin biosynthesis protein CobD [Ktedonobacteraceae bacterium]|nr:cobalamin biosynthesis protein CobD [Ktedonobacteraceae bacterium]